MFAGLQDTELHVDVCVLLICVIACSQMEAGVVGVCRLRGCRLSALGLLLLCEGFDDIAARQGGAPARESTCVR